MYVEDRGFLMVHGRFPEGSPEDVLGLLMRRALEPFGSMVADVGFAGAVRIYVRVARRLEEVSPGEAGEFALGGVRDAGALWLIGEDAERARGEIAESGGVPHDVLIARVAARVFGAIAYRHPFFDANKRTAFVAAMLVGWNMGLRLRSFDVEVLDDAIIDLTAREAPDDEVARWLLSKVFIAGDPEGEVRE
jgi:hypothetical protein